MHARSDALRTWFDLCVRGDAAGVLRWLSSAGAEGRRILATTLQSSIGQHFLVLLAHCKASKKMHAADLAAARQTQTELALTSLAASTDALATLHASLLAQQHGVKRSISTMMWDVHTQQTRSQRRIDNIGQQALDAAAAAAGVEAEAAEQSELP
jgi:hypothetical protein